MEFANQNPSLDIIIGPMFSGKTTELIRRLTIFQKIGKVLYINSNLDNRGENDISTHNEMIRDNIRHFDTLKVKELNGEVIEICAKYDIIGVDEAQFFELLENFCLTLVDGLGKKVIIAGLNGNSSRKPFGYISSLIPHCDSISKLYPFCKSCSDKGRIVPALFSKRIDISSQDILIGAEDKYIPVCRLCY